MQKLIVAFLVVVGFVFVSVQSGQCAKKPTKNSKVTEEAIYKEKIIEKVKVIYGTDDLEEIVFKLESQIRREKEAESEDEAASIPTESNEDQNMGPFDKISDNVCSEVATVALEAYNMLASGEDVQAVKKKIDENRLQKDVILSSSSGKEMVFKMVDMLDELIKKDGDMRKSEEVKELVKMGIDFDRILYSQFKSTCADGVKQSFEAFTKW